VWACPAAMLGFVDIATVARRYSEVEAMTLSELKVESPENLVLDFASDPVAPFDKLLKKSIDSGCC